MTRDELLALIDQAENEGRTELDLSGKGLTELPPEIGRLTKLTDLNLSDNQLTELPSAIGRLTKLTYLDLTDNRLTELPPEISHLTRLTRFHIGHNEFQKLPEIIKSLKSLIALTVYKLGIRELPNWLFDLRNLEWLGVGENKLTKIPKLISKLVNLQALLAYNNRIVSLPPELYTLSKLELLDFVGNQIREVPTSYHRFRKFTHVVVRKAYIHPHEEILYTTELWLNEGLRFPPIEVTQLGIKSFLNYLGAAHYSSKYVWESKCLIVGEGGVGKTCLYNILNGRLCEDYEQGTIGIEIGPLDLPYPDNKDATMRLNCWDFAGQDFNHAMHQFFFSNRALFLLVWNARHGWQQGKLYRWLENIKVRAPEAKVILVATHTDQPHSDYPAADLQAKYPQIVDTIEVSSKTGDKIPELRQLIQKHAADLPLMGLRWPQTWLDAANAVRAMCEAGRKHASRREVVSVMKEHDLNEEECGILMRWLHELGDILHFDDEPEMRGRVILDPEWLTRHIGIVLRSDEVQQQNGILTRQHLDKLWEDLDDFLRDHFLRMMDKFDLAYLIPDDPQDRSLIVERLPLDPPDYAPQWQEFEEHGNEISLRFKLGSLQPGIPTWFIARCHRFTMNTHWLNGVLFKDEDDRHRALIIADDRDNMVQMTVRGPFPQRFMALLRDGFRDTLKRYKGLEVERWVPCPGYNELEEHACKNEFRLDILESWLEKKPDRITFTCPECDTELSRLQLVEGIGAAALTQQLTEERMAELLSEAHTKTQQEIKDHIDYRIEDVLKYQQRNFLRAFYLEQDREMVTCPNLFTVRQVPKSGVVKKQEWQIQLYCQQPGAWHSVGKPYIIEEQKEWFTKALPYLKTLLKVLSVVAPLANAALAITDVVGDKVQFAHDQHVTFENEVKMMGELLKGTKVVAEMERPLGERIHDLPERSTFRKAEGAELVPIRELMDQLAEIDEQKGRPKWAGLTRRQTPEGDILWLDQEHLQEYLSKRKPVPQPEDLE